MWIFPRLILLAVLIVLPALPTNLQAQVVHSQTNQPSTKVSSAEKPKKYPYHGALGQVDTANQTISIPGKKKTRVIQITPETRIQKNGEPCKLTDGVVGEPVGGQCYKDDQGREIAVSLRFGPAPEKGQKSKNAGAVATGKPAEKIPPAGQGTAPKAYPK